MLTQEFPNPGYRRRIVPSDYPGLPNGILELRVPEIDRRWNQINKVDPNHPLLAVTLDCLKDSYVEHPSAQHLCKRVAALKETPEYNESEKGIPENVQPIIQSQKCLQEKNEPTSVADFATTNKLEQLYI